MPGGVTDMMILAILAAIVVGLCYVALFTYFAWPDLRGLVGRKVKP